MKTASIIIFAPIALAFVLIVYSILWYKFGKPIRERRIREYDELFKDIQKRLLDKPCKKELDLIKTDLNKLQALKYKNSEATKFILFEWIKQRYGMTKKEMAEIN